MLPLTPTTNKHIDEREESPDIFSSSDAYSISPVPVKTPRRKSASGNGAFTTPTYTRANQRKKTETVENTPSNTLTSQIKPAAATILTTPKQASRLLQYAIPPITPATKKNIDGREESPDIFSSPDAYCIYKPPVCVKTPRRKSKGKNGALTTPTHTNQRKETETVKNTLTKTPTFQNKPAAHTIPAHKSSCHIKLATATTTTPATPITAVNPKAHHQQHAQTITYSSGWIIRSDSMGFIREVPKATQKRFDAAIYDFPVSPKSKGEEGWGM
ncbi:hypothetical protein BDD12DRAFT_121518 [Trichophaea hybrida]|nr:hypothetical protein BDD12DRAFT_121518 [Trichophaea hybrida]